MTHDLPAVSGRHPINVGHFVMGLAFVGILGIWALIQGDVVDGGDVRWLLPLPWVLAGIAGLLATTVSGRRATSRTGWVAQPPATSVAAGDDRQDEETIAAVDDDGAANDNEETR